MEKVLEGPRKMKDPQTPQVRISAGRRFKINPLNEAVEWREKSVKPELRSRSGKVPSE